SSLESLQVSGHCIADVGNRIAPGEVLYERFGSLFQLAACCIEGRDLLDQRLRAGDEYAVLEYVLKGIPTERLADHGNAVDERIEASHGREQLPFIGQVEIEDGPAAEHLGVPGVAIDVEQYPHIDACLVQLYEDSLPSLTQHSVEQQRISGGSPKIVPLERCAIVEGNLSLPVVRYLRQIVA